MPIEITPEIVTNYGPLIVFFAFVLGVIAHWYFKRYPNEQKERSEMMKLLIEQIVLSRQALDTSNLVIKQNIEEFKDTRSSHQRLWERMEILESILTRHDMRAEDVARDTNATRADVIEIRRLIEYQRSKE